jgi:hypothetical protein
MIKLIKLTTKDLMIVLIDKERLLQLEELNEENCLAEMLDISRYIGNDWYCNQIIGLTEAPNICKGSIYWDSLPNRLYNEYIEYVKTETSDCLGFTPPSYEDYVKNTKGTLNEDLPIDFEHVWYYPSYMTKSFVDELLNHGFVIFKGI